MGGELGDDKKCRDLDLDSRAGVPGWGENLGCPGQPKNSDGPNKILISDDGRRVLRKSRTTGELF